MSKAQPQTRDSETPVYAKELLEVKLRNLQWKMDWLLRNFHVAWRNLMETRGKLAETSSISLETVTRFDNAMEELKNTIYDAVDEMIVNELRLDVDVEKYEKQYRVKFSHDSEHIVGVALLESGGKVKPVAICTDYKTLWYHEGETRS
jgi:hypothetical protein